MNIEKNLDLNKPIKIRLKHYENDDFRIIANAMLSFFCFSNDIFLKKCNYSEKLDIYKTKNINKKMLNELMELDIIEKIEQMPDITLD